MREKLEALKVGATKKDPECVVDNYTTIGDYLLTYCLETFGDREQKTLAISRRLDEKRPDFRKINEEIPELKDVFFPNNRVAFFQKNYPHRGHTLILVIMDKGDESGA
jgi:hypothetical protein